MYLDHVPLGKLLEVGCGNGQRLLSFRNCGWQVEGQEVDQKAAEKVRTEFGIGVHIGKLEYLGLSEASYDAIIMNHVIEHVHDPIGLLKECRRLLKPGGCIVAITPNIESRGHRKFGACWRGLEPPRHLHLFSTPALNRLARKAGFSEIRTWTTAAKAEGMARASIGIVQKRTNYLAFASRIANGFSALFFQLVSSLLITINKRTGEECVVKIVK